MNDTEKQTTQSRGWLFALVALFVISVAVFLVTFLLDHTGADASLTDLLFSSVAHGSLAGMPEVIAGILGISITVVAIIVELASNRYTSRITELFVTSFVNVSVLSFFVVTGLLCIWVSLTGADPEYVPKVGAITVALFVSLCMLILLPYFAFVFSFLEPHNIIDTMAASSLKAVATGGAKSGGNLDRFKHNAVKGIEQLADVSLNAIENKDKVICMHAVNALGRLLCDYQAVKGGFTPRWFDMTRAVRENPDFVSMQPGVLDDIENGKYWFEMKILRQYQMLYSETLNRMRDINYLIAINTRKAAENAIRSGDDTVVAQTIKFFNTYMRATINARDVRTAYNVFNQYRLLAGFAIESGRSDVTLEIARKFQYYGQLGFAAGLAFVLETAAYDLCELNELAYKKSSDSILQLLDIFLEIDKEAEEGHALEASLRGVRKAQVKLATFYLTHQEEQLARVVYDDMKEELTSRLVSIQEELEGITAKDFWEISDRGVNFDYLSPKRREKLAVFFGWFENLDHQQDQT